MRTSNLKNVGKIARYHPSCSTEMRWTLISPEEAKCLLERLGAPKRLIKHADLVLESGQEILLLLEELNVEIDEPLALTGMALHDVGKIAHPNELRESGNLHESAGQKLLLEQGVSEKIARFCISHAQYQEMSVSLEELLVALADKLWKGKREPELELRVIDEVAARLQKDRWAVFEQLDTGFEAVAASGDRRLARSTL